MMKKQEEQLSYATSKKNMTKLKAVFVGDQATGKSSIINRFIKNEFDPNHNPTVGIDFVSKNIVVSGNNVRLQLWDTAGQERFRSLIPTYLRDSQAVIIIYDVTNMESFESVPHWIDFVKQYRDEETSIFVVGNKIDKTEEKVVSSDLVKEKFKSIPVNCKQVSAKDGTNLHELFQLVCSVVMQVPDMQGRGIQVEKSKIVGKTIQMKRQQMQMKGSKLVSNKQFGNNRVTRKQCC